MVSGVRRICALDFTDRDVAAPDRETMDDQGIDFEPNDRIFFMFGSANRDEQYFDRGDVFDVTRDTSKSIAFRTGPHFSPALGLRGRWSLTSRYQQSSDPSKICGLLMTSRFALAAGRFAAC